MASYSLQPLGDNINQQAQVEVQADEQVQGKDDEHSDEEDDEHSDEEDGEDSDEEDGGQDPEQQAEKLARDVSDKLTEIFSRSNKIEILKEILPYTKDTLKSNELISDQLKQSLIQYESLANMDFEVQYGKGIKDNKEEIAQVVQNLLADQLEQMNRVTNGQYDNTEISSLIPPKNYESEESDASTIKPYKSVSSENSIISKDSNSNDSNKSSSPASEKPSLIDDFADVSQVMQDWFGGDD